MKKAIFKTVLFNLLLATPILSFAAFSDQTSVNSKPGREVLEMYANILDFCHKNDLDIDSCLKKLKTQQTEQKSAANQVKGGLCCVNVSGGVGEYAYIHGQAYCIPPC